MKELSIEEKAKRYDEAIEKFDVILNLSTVKESGTIFADDVRKILPELKESKGERIRKAIIEFFELQDDNTTYSFIPKKDILDWLEKQGESTDKVEPKFHEGDWVVSPNGVYWHIDKISNNRYEVTSNTGESSSWNLDTNIYHKFNIQDAKDGDVLANNGNIILFKEILNSARKDYKYIKSHCFVLIHSFHFHTEGSYNLDDGFHPATKEQRDTLLKAMADAGYTFDFEKKELKKIEQKSDNKTPYPKTLDKAIDLYYYSYGDSEGGFDFLSLDKFRDIVHTFIDDYGQKSSEWSDEDEYLFEEIKRCVGIQYPFGNTEIFKFLKSLRPQIQWRPSDEQMDALRYVANFDYGGHKATLVSLYEQLKKLREK